MSGTREHQVPLESGNKCGKFREMFAEETSMETILKRKKYA
jgi:hypothetical protein